MKSDESGVNPELLRNCVAEKFSAESDLRRGLCRISCPVL